MRTGMYCPRFLTTKSVTATKNAPIMKKLFSIIIMVTILAGCKRNEVPVYDGPKAVYFDVYRDYSISANYLADSTLITFAYSPELNDTTVYLRIRTQGDTTGSTRDLSIRIIDTAAKAARRDQFDLPATISVPGKNQVMLPVRLKKSADMQTDTFTLTLELVENAQFKVPVSTVHVAELGRAVNVKRHIVVFNDILMQPKYWVSGYLGSWSRKKHLLMSEVLGYPVNFLEISVLPGTVKFYGRYVRNYLETEAAAGRTVLDEDGSVMKMGDSL